MSERAESVELANIEIDDGFWSPRIETNRDVTLEYQYEQLEESGVLENFRVAAGWKSGEFQNMRFADSDAYKWLEAASYAYANDPDPTLDERMDDVIELIGAAQEDDGYLNTAFTIRHTGKKWTDLGLGHELYCAGHLFEAAVAHHEATTKESLLEIAIDFADHIDARFGPSKERGYPGHEEVEIGLVKLYRTTGDDRYLDLATYFIDERGQSPSVFERELETFDGRAGNLQHYRDLFEDDDGNYDGSYAQDHAPVREQDTVEGHSVRAMYLYTGMADVVAETGDDSLLATLERLWDNMVERRMYVTGGIGSSHEGERFTEDYDLPNATAYAETCAAVGSVFWNHRMQQITRESRFVDVMERVLYNGFLSGVSLSGDQFFYTNPLESFGDHRRRGWFTCACCPPNVSRLLTSLGRYIYTVDSDEGAVYANLFVGSTATLSLGEEDIEITQRTDYPWKGSVEFEVSTSSPSEFTFHVRLPDWCREASVRVNGDPYDIEPDEGYAPVTRTWEEGETVDLDFSMPVERACAHPSVDADLGRIALRRGPLVYCLEEADNPTPLRHLRLTDDPVDADHRSDVLGGVTLLRGRAAYVSPDEWTGRLYRSLDRIEITPVEVTAVPYYAWGNRDPGEMLVWLRSDR